MMRDLPHVNPSQDGQDRAEHLAPAATFRMVMCLLAGSGEVLGRQPRGPLAHPPVDRPGVTPRAVALSGPTGPDARALSRPAARGAPPLEKRAEHIALLTRSKAALAVLVSAVVAGRRSHRRRLRRDEQDRDPLGRRQDPAGPHVRRAHVADVLKTEGIAIGEHDVVAPGLDLRRRRRHPIAVKYGRPLDVKVDGEKRPLLGHRDRRGQRARPDRPPVRRRRPVRQPRRRHQPLRHRPGGRHPEDADGQARRRDEASKTTVTALTVRDALKELGKPADGNDQVKPGLGAKIEDGDKLTLTKVRVVQRKVTEPIDARHREEAGLGHVHRPVEDPARRRRRPPQRGLQGHLRERRAGRPQGDAQQHRCASRSTRSSRSAPRSAPRPRPRRLPTTPAAAASGTRSPRASPVATGPPTPATATTAVSSSASAPGRRTAAPAGRTSRAVRRRSPWPSGWQRPRAATAPGRCAGPAG